MGADGFRLAGVDPATRYRVREVNPPARARATMRQVPPLTFGRTLTANGALLAHTGIALPVLRAGEIAVFLLQREDA